MLFMAVALPATTTLSGLGSCVSPGACWNNLRPAMLRSSGVAYDGSDRARPLPDRTGRKSLLRLPLLRWVLANWWRSSARAGPDAVQHPTLKGDQTTAGSSSMRWCYRGLRHSPWPSAHPPATQLRVLDGPHGGTAQGTGQQRFRKEMTVIVLCDPGHRAGPKLWRQITRFRAGILHVGIGRTSASAPIVRPPVALHSASFHRPPIRPGIMATRQPLSHCTIIWIPNAR